jgi:eukaryotic-like serine/threonine-protein kinase
MTEEPIERTVQQVTDPTVEVPVPFVLPKIEGYDITREIDRGGMGIVYEGRHLKLGRTVALKMLPRGATPDQVAIDKFAAEAQVVASIRHQNVVMVHDYGVSFNTPYLIMEYLSGGSLASRLKAGPMPFRAAAELLLKLADGVAAAHAQDVVHRDLKPANVLFDDADEPKVVDFGLAKRVLPDTTVTQAVQGTPQYMSPEQAKADGTPIDTRTDVWALGVILYECLTGLRPFVAPDPYSTIRRIIDEKPVAPHSIPASRDIPEALETICLKCLEKQPAKRYADAEKLADELRRFLNGESILARLDQPRSWRLPVAITAATLAIFGSGTWYFTRNSTSPTENVSPNGFISAADPGRAGEVQRIVEAILRTPPRPDAVQPHPLTTVEQLNPPDLSAFQHLEDERIIDMRGWRPLPADNLDSIDPATGSAVIFRERVRLLKLAATDTFTVESRTTGRLIVPRTITPNPIAAVTRFASRPGFVGQQAMKVYQMNLDVSNIPVDQEFETRSQATYWSSLQLPEDRWVGTIGKDGTLKTTLIFLFPTDRPFKRYQLRIAPTRQSAPVPFDGPKILYEDPAKFWIYWEIRLPKAGNVYRVDFEW